MKTFTTTLTKTFTISSVSALLVAGAFTATAQAQQGPMEMTPYLGADAMYWEIDPDNGNDIDSVGLRLNGGVQFNDYFALEAHAGTGGSDNGVDLDYLVGAYAKGILPISPEFRIFGLLGGTEVELSASGLGSDSESDFSYGAGAELDLAPNLSVGADYMRYLDESDFDFDAATLGLRYRF
jgi:opacity protein-like surface antigen